jgi:HEPN domain-containing protein
MSDATTYPGSSASVEEIVHLAREYQMAARTLLLNARRGKPLSSAPARLCAIHAIELYLNAFLLSLGDTPEQIRSRRHDLAERARLALDHGLKLRKKTAEHLDRLSQDREYLVSRYGPELASTLSEVNRLMATLEEVAKKVQGVVLGQDATGDVVQPAPALK